MSITLELPQNLQEASLRFAQEQNMTQEEWIEKALLEYIENIGDLAIALQGQKERLAGENGIPLSIIMEKYGMN